MVDIHTHIMPNIDDGAESINETYEMLKMEIEQGVTDVILTPHAINIPKKRKEYDEYLNGFKTVQNIISSNDLNINVYLGCEIFILDTTYDDLINKRIHTIENSKNILVELPLTEIMTFKQIENALYNLSLRYKVILAHAERYHYLRIEDIFKLSKYADIQVNAGSILGVEGDYVKKRSFQLLKNKIPSYVASDCHSTRTRRPNLKEARVIVEKKYGKEYSDLVFDINPNKLIKDITGVWVK